MYSMYVDDSGDPGNNTVQSNCFCLSGIAVHENEWRNFINASRNFRRTLKEVHGFPGPEKLHAVKFLRHSQLDIPRHRRLAVLRNYLDKLAKQNFPSIRTAP